MGENIQESKHSEIVYHNSAFTPPNILVSRRLKVSHSRLGCTQVSKLGLRQYYILKIGENMKKTKIPRLFKLTQPLLPLISWCHSICLISQLNAEHEQLVSHSPLGATQCPNKGLRNLLKMSENIQKTKIPRLFILTQTLFTLICRC